MISFLLSALVLLTSAIATSIPRQALATTTSIFKFNTSTASIENLVVRSNGQILITRFDVPEIWSIDPLTKTSELLFSLPDITCTAGITELEPDVFAVVGGNYSSSGGNVAGSWGIYKIDLSFGSPLLRGYMPVPESVMFNGLTTLNSNIILIADGKGVVYRMQMTTGEYGIAAQDKSMEPPSWAPIPLGIDGLRYFNGSIYWTNIFGKTFGKMNVDRTGKAYGEVTSLWNGTQADDFAVGLDGAAYVATNSELGVIRLGVGGQMSTVSMVKGSTSCVFGRGEKDSNVLYISAGNEILSVVV